MKRLRNLSLTDLYTRLHDAGMSIGIPNLKIAIDNGFLKGLVFPCTEPDSSRDYYIIIEKDVDEWIEAHSKDEQPDDIMLEFAATIQTDAAKEGSPCTTHTDSLSA